MKRENENNYYFVTVKATVIDYYYLLIHILVDSSIYWFPNISPSLPQTVNKEPRFFPQLTYPKTTGIIFGKKRIFCLSYKASRKTIIIDNRSLTITD